MTMGVHATGRQWTLRRRLTIVFVSVLLAVAGLDLAPGSANAGAQTALPPDVSQVPYRTTGDVPSGTGVGAWVQRVPGVADVQIPSTIDGQRQQAMWFAPNEPGPRPLLVVVHSWSNSYDQHASIPYAQWAQQNGWAMVAPTFGVHFEPRKAQDLTWRFVEFRRATDTL